MQVFGDGGPSGKGSSVGVRWVRVSVWMGSVFEVDFMIHYVAVHMSSVFRKTWVLPFSVLHLPESVTSLVHLFQRE